MNKICRQVFQRRKDSSENFSRNWDDYKRGFGNLTGEFWLGIHSCFFLTCFIFVTFFSVFTLPICSFWFVFFCYFCCFSLIFVFLFDVFIFLMDEQNCSKTRIYSCIRSQVIYIIISYNLSNII